MGFAIGSIEGRVQLEHFNEMPNAQLPPNCPRKAGKPSNFAFKCHREKQPDDSCDIYAINCIAYNCRNTLATAGNFLQFHFDCIL